ncbi:outer membrane protein [Salinisphaera sp. PC39]|uniref:TolC family protein n=1 Tax=Salinisphaera sp. PC39 TaxID=1304156 RepID=UPI00334002F2
MALRLCAGVCLLAAAFGVAAMDDTLTLKGAIARAVADNPELAVGVFRRRAADARIESAGQPPPTRLGLELENFAGSGETRGLRAADATLLLSRTLERGGKAARREDLALSRRALVATEADIRRLDLLARVARRFVHVARDQALLTLAEEAVALAEKARMQAARRVDAGAAPASEAARADIALADAGLGLEHAEHELKATRVGLSSLWGERDPGFDRVAAELFELPAADTIQTVMARLERNPQQRRLADEARVAAARQRLAAARRATDITVSGGMRWRESTDDSAFVLGVSIPLASRSRAQPDLAASRAEHAARERELEAAERELYAVVYARYQEMHHARTEVETLRGRILPRAREALADIRAGYGRGRYSYLDLAEAQRSLIRQERRAIHAAASYHRHLIEIERLTGTPAATPDED